MSSAIRFSLPFKSLCFSCDQHYPKSAFRRASLATNHDVCSRKIDLNGGYDRIKALTSHSEEGSVQGLESSLVSVQLEPISSESQFDRLVDEAQQLEESVVIVWMASWCRKCVYLKPKLEKLAADYYPRIRFYCLDVNNVPHKLVVRAGVTKMPTIQLWKDGKKQAEVIGGHKAYLVVNEVHDMIENESSVNIIVFTGTSDI